MAGWRHGEGWVNLQYDDEEMADAMAPSMPQPPQYPYGTRICLTGRELEKCGLPLPKLGDLLDFRAMAEVTGVPDANRVELQIVLMKCIDNEDTEDDDDE